MVWRRPGVYWPIYASLCLNKLNNWVFFNVILFSDAIAKKFLYETGPVP